jgi:hypothetical protein
MYDVVMDEWQSRDQFFNRLRNMTTYKIKADFDVEFIGFLQGQERPVYRFSTSNQISFIPPGWAPKPTSALLQPGNDNIKLKLRKKADTGPTA